jgi:hypothetical protein
MAYIFCSVEKAEWYFGVKKRESNFTKPSLKADLEIP